MLITDGKSDIGIIVANPQTYQLDNLTTAPVSPNFRIKSARVLLHTFKHMLFLDCRLDWANAGKEFPNRDYAWSVLIKDS